MSGEKGPSSGVIMVLGLFLIVFCLGFMTGLLFDNIQITWK